MKQHLQKRQNAFIFLQLSVCKDNQDSISYKYRLNEGHVKIIWYPLSFHLIKVRISVLQLCTEVHLAFPEPLFHSEYHIPST